MELFIIIVKHPRISLLIYWRIRRKRSNQGNKCTFSLALIIHSFIQINVQKNYCEFYFNTLTFSEINGQSLVSLVKHKERRKGPLRSIKPKLISFLHVAVLHYIFLPSSTHTLAKRKRERERSEDDDTVIGCEWPNRQLPSPQLFRAEEDVNAGGGNGRSREYNRLLTQSIESKKK